MKYMHYSLSVLQITSILVFPGVLFLSRQKHIFVVFNLQFLFTVEMKRLMYSCFPVALLVGVIMSADEWPSVTPCRRRA